FLDRLNEHDSKEAILKPIEGTNTPVRFGASAVQTIHKVSRGYPYFIQYVCREAFDIWIQNAETGGKLKPIPVPEILRKLDADFFAGRWARATDRQRDLLGVIARLENSASEFT